MYDITIIERAKRAHSLFMSIEISDIYIIIYIYVREVRVSCVPFFPVYPETPLKIVLTIYSILEMSRNIIIHITLYIF